MRNVKKIAPLVAVVLFVAQPLMGSGPFIYPNKGQSKEQLEKDKYECYQWAKQQSGFDPMDPPKVSTPPPQTDTKKGGILKGGLIGGAGGAAIGGIASGDPGKGAAIGAVAGGLIGGIRRRRAKKEAKKESDQWAGQQAANYHHARESYNRAYNACLVGRDYTVQ